MPLAVDMKHVNLFLEKIFLCNFYICALVWSFLIAIVVDQTVMACKSAVHSVLLLLACEISYSVFFSTLKPINPNALSWYRSPEALVPLPCIQLCNYYSSPPWRDVTKFQAYYMDVHIYNTF